MNATATGAWANLSQSAGRGDLLYAGIEGVVFGITDALDAVLEMVEKSETEVKVGGGGARSAGYLSLLCNTAGRPLHILADTNTTAVGAAILGAVAAELFPDIESAVSQMATKTTWILYPEHTKHLTLRDRRKQWKDVTCRLL
jgi:xylulokinase